MAARSERVRDMKIVCRRCRTTVVDRLTARCPRCTDRIARERTIADTASDGQSTDRADDNTIVTRTAMRMTRYSANDTYYPQTITMLRLDKPDITNDDDVEQRELRALLPLNERPDVSRNPAEIIRALTEMLSRPEVAGDEGRRREILNRISAVATSSIESEEKQPEPAAAAAVTEVDVIKAIRESLAFRTKVHTVDAFGVARTGGGATSLLKGQISGLKQQLGIRQLLLVEDLPVITATFGFTRRTFQPTYEELSAKDLPTEIRVFPSLDRAAAQRLSRLDLFGTVPILAREGEHEGIFISLDPSRVLAWLGHNGISTAGDGDRSVTKILAALEPIDRYYDDIWSCRVRRLVFGLVHTLSHAAMRAASWYSGLERTSLCEYLFLPLFGTVIFDNSSSFRLGGLETLVRDHLSGFLDAIATDAVTCVYDSECIDSRGACHGCIHSPEISCRVFNHGLSRAFLVGGHTPWLDVTADEQIYGYWQMTGE